VFLGLTRLVMMPALYALYFASFENASLHPESPFAIASFAVLAFGRLEIT